MVRIEEMNENAFVANALFCKDKNGKIRFWKAIAKGRGFDSYTGNLDRDGSISNFKRNFINVNANHIRSITAQVAFELAARYKHKINSGFRYLIDHGLLYDEDRNCFDGNGGLECLSLHNFLIKNLPIHRYDELDNLKPMLAKTFKHGRVTYPRIGQPKINGIRGLLRWTKVTTGEGVFQTTIEGPAMYSREGNRFVVPKIEQYFSRDMFFQGGQELVYDGELYIHGVSLNVIKSCIPTALSDGRVSNTSGDPDRLQFWVFDLAILKPQRERLDMLKQKLKCNRLIDITELHIKSMINYKVLRIPYYNVTDDMDAKMLAARCIDHGFEGAILRDPDELYKFGYRGATMYKLKRVKHTECIIVDIIPKPRESDTGLFVLRNDINEEIFECNPMGTFLERKDYLDNKDRYIGKLATVKYYERSGVKECPFHANVETIRDYK